MNKIIHMNSIKIILALTLCAIAQLNVNADNRSLKLALEKSIKTQTPVFLIVTDKSTNNKSLKQAYAVIEEAKSEIGNLNVFELDKSSPKNADFVQKWQLNDESLPLIIALSPKGNYSGRIPANAASTDKLVKLIPSPKLDEIYTISTNHKAILIVMGSRTDDVKAEVLENCQKAITKMKGKADVVNIDFEDTAEHDLLLSMKVNPLREKVITMVINKYGVKTKVFKGKISVDKIMTAALNEIEESCSHGSCGHQH